MKRMIKLGVLLLSLFFFSSLSYAGEYQDKLNQCFKTATSVQDRKNLNEWMFFAIASHPDIEKFTRVSSSDHEKSDQKVAKIFENIFMHQCHTEIKDVIRYEGTNALENAFEYLGKIASGSLLLNSNVRERIMHFNEYLDAEKLEKSFN